MKDGYYWVKIGNEWIIAELVTEIIYLYGKEEVSRWHIRDNICDYEDIDEIGDYIETPDKYKE